MELEWVYLRHKLTNKTWFVKENNVSMSKIIIEENILIVIPQELSIIFQIIIWPTVIIGFMANIAVLFKIFSTSSKENLKLKPCYRCTLFSFALSDLTLLLTSGMNTLSIVVTRKILWIYPDWACAIIPYLQTVAVLIGSLTLAGVAIERYIAVKPKYPRPQPRIRSWIYPIFFVLFTWCTAAASSYLILNIYSPELINVVKNDTCYEAKVCIMKDRAKISYIYTALFVIIFLPLALIFVVIHILLAINMWQRKELNLEILRVTRNIESSTVSHMVKQPQESDLPVDLSQRTTRRSRIVKIILILIIVFGVCRLPLWVFLMLKLHKKLENRWWYIQILLTTMSFFNAAANPFLYAFLNDVLSLIGFLKLRMFTKKVEENSKNDLK